MKHLSIPFSARFFLIIFVLIFALQPSAISLAQTVLHQSHNNTSPGVSAPSPASATASACTWTYYPVLGGALQAEQPLFADPDSTPIDQMSVGNLFKGKSTHLADTGSTDFNGDNKTDVFRTLPRPDGDLQWQYSSGGTGAWQNLAYATSVLPVSQLQFGNFNGDPKTDVFASLYSSILAAYQWQYSPGGTGSFANLATLNTYPNRLALGDFNGDGVTDVFTAIQQNNTYQWAYSPGGAISLINLAFDAGDPALLRFGDFNGDGVTDVFTARQLPDGSTQWMYSSGGAVSFTNLNTSTIPYAELKFGDFNGDGVTDVLAAEPQSDGSLQVVVWPGGLGAGVTLGRIPAPAPALRVGDFNGDGISDLLAYRCGMPGPLVLPQIQTLAASGYKTFQRIQTGDVNGDGQADLILVSTCQNSNAFGTCASHHLQVGVALGASSHTYTLAAPQQLGADALDFNYYKVLAGDFDGDGKTDLALVYLSSPNLTIYFAHSNGDGTFNLGPAQNFAGSWNSYNPIVGDFNGDGKADLAFTTVCSFTNSSCSNGENNAVVVATAGIGGVFSMGSLQNLGSPAGWGDYMTLAGDFNGDGKTDLVFNSTCQKINFIDTTCTAGDANIVFTALSTGTSSFTMSAPQIFGGSGWADYRYFSDLAGDLNGDGRADLVWTSGYQSVAKTYNNLVAAALANPDGSFQISPIQDFGSAWMGVLSLVDLNRDGKADLLWNDPPLGDTDVDTYAVALSNGNGTFNNRGPGSFFTGAGFFIQPETDTGVHIPNSLVVVSTHQDSISSALFVINGYLLTNKTYLPMLSK